MSLPLRRNLFRASDIVSYRPIWARRPISDKINMPDKRKADRSVSPPTLKRKVQSSTTRMIDPVHRLYFVC